MDKAGQLRLQGIQALHQAREASDDPGEQDPQQYAQDPAGQEQQEQCPYLPVDFQLPLHLLEQGPEDGHEEHGRQHRRGQRRDDLQEKINCPCEQEQYYESVFFDFLCHTDHHAFPRTWSAPCLRPQPASRISMVAFGKIITVKKCLWHLTDSMSVWRRTFL